MALFDVGEFTRFYPNGRVVVSRLGAKDKVMQMMDSDNAEVKLHCQSCTILIVCSFVAVSVKYTRRKNTIRLTHT